MTTDEDRIRATISDWAAAVAAGDRAGILADHTDDLVMIDFPNTIHGIDAYARSWDFFDDSRRGPVTFEPAAIDVTAGETVAFAHCEVHCDGTTAGSFDFRLTTGLIKRDGGWVISHEHHSVPTSDAVLIGPDVAAAAER